jgi:hypothetical protein
MGQAGEAFAGIPLSKRHPIDVDHVRAEAGTAIEGREWKCTVRSLDDLRFEANGLCRPSD